MLDPDEGMRLLRHELVEKRIDDDAHRQRLDGRCPERLGGSQSHVYPFCCARRLAGWTAVVNPSPAPRERVAAATAAAG
jgi:hypothetical protein